MMAIIRMQSLFIFSSPLMMSNFIQVRVRRNGENIGSGPIHRYETIIVMVSLIIHHSHFVYGYGVVVKLLFKQPTKVESLS